MTIPALPLSHARTTRRLTSRPPPPENEPEWSDVTAPDDELLNWKSKGWVDGRLGVKVSGGIRTRDQALAMVAARATRLGLSATRAVLEDLPAAGARENGSPG